MKKNSIVWFVLLVVILFITLMVFALFFPNLKGYFSYLENIVVSIGTTLSIPTIFFLFKEFQEKQHDKWEKKLSVLKEKDKYLNISVNVQNHNGYVSIKTQVFNHTNEPQKIAYAFLLISEQENWTNVTNLVNQKYGLGVQYTNDFQKLEGFIEEPLWIPKMGGIIPLGFYYKENIRIANENPSFVYSFNNKEVLLPEGIYSVRFYIFPKDERYHRTTVDSLIIPEKYS